MSEVPPQVLSPVAQTTTNVSFDKKTANLLGMDRLALEEFFEAIGEKKFRATQVMKWIHQMGVTDFMEMNLVAIYSVDLSLGVGKAGECFCCQLLRFGTGSSLLSSVAGNFPQQHRHRSTISNPGNVH